MDLMSILLFCMMSLVIGAVLMILIQYYAFVKYFNASESNGDKRTSSLNEKYQLPDAILASIHSPELENRNPTIAFNLIFQFLFFELRNANKVRKWFHRKLSMELDELISKTTTGKLFDKLSIRDLDLGAQFPEIKNIKVLNADLHDTEGHLDNLELVLDLHYSGNFRMAIDADMVLGKKGSLSVKVKHISGLARLQFTRRPYTHWSLCFMGDPVIDFDIETQFQGRQMQSNVTSLISNQIRKAIRRKHTLPNYKLRYKPFFHTTPEEEHDLSDITLDGSIEVNIAELTRLSFSCHVQKVFCTITLAPIEWVTARQYDDKNIAIVLDVEIRKAKNQQIGLIFKQTDQIVMVETVIPNTPAMKSNICSRDVLISIEGKRVANINHIAKLVKGLSRPVFTMRIERMVRGQILSDVPTMVEEKDGFTVIDNGECDDGGDTGTENGGAASISFSKNADSVQIGNRTRHSSMDKISTESSRSNTPTHSPCKSRTEGIFSRARSRSRHNNELKATTDGEMTRSVGGSFKLRKEFESVNRNDENGFQQHTSEECDVDSFITTNDIHCFRLNSNSVYFNLNILGRCNDEVILLGYLNIPVMSILAECNESTLRHFVKQFTLNPPDTPNLSTHALSMQSGFDPKLCFGDALMSFAWSGSAAGSAPTPLSETPKKTKSAKLSASTEKLNEDITMVNSSKQHDFVSTHFQRATQCDFCRRKIWLKDAAQCKDCAMCCHKKCITKCQNSTICGPVDAVAASAAILPSVEFKLTEAEDVADEVDDFEVNEEQCRPRLEQHRQSFSDLISQGIKRVNSAHNLAIPAIVSTLNQGSRSLPPSPQHTPRKQSLVNQSTNPFVIAAQKLDQLPNELAVADITRQQVVGLTEPLIGYGTPDEMMALAKKASRNLYSEFEPNERVQIINHLLSKLRLCLDSETTAHANLTMLPAESAKLTELANRNDSTAIKLTDSTAKNSKENPHDEARKAFLVGQSEERVQALSILMLHLCTGLQYAQGVVSQ